MLEGTTLYLIAADLLLTLHVAFVMFVVLGLLLILLGKPLCWQWVRHPWFRWLHLSAIAYVVVQAWLGKICPLTIWEMELRAMAGDATYSGAFIAHWLNELLYFDAPSWVFTLVYSVFGALVLVSWFWVKPQRSKHRTD